MTTKGTTSFYMQAWDSWTKINRSLVLRDRAIPEKNARLILKLFKDNLINLGEIILGSKVNMDKIFDGYKEDPHQGYSNDMGLY